jgi:predicted RNA methylase
MRPTIWIVTSAAMRRWAAGGPPGGSGEPSGVKASQPTRVCGRIAPERHYDWRVGAVRERLAPRYRLLRDRLGRAVFERGFVDTATQVPLEELGGIEDPERTRYEASGWFFLRRALRQRDVRAGVDVFADFGSGKGRVVYQAAARYPFKRVIGVEIAESLNQVARTNIDRNRRRLKCQDVEIVTADATTYEIPDDLTIAYFYSPFLGTAFRKVIDNLVDSLARAPRELRIVYANPTLGDYVETTGSFELVRETRGLRRSIKSRHIRVYAAKPELTRIRPGAGAGA